MEATTTIKSTYRAVILYSTPEGGKAYLAERETADEAMADAERIITSGNLHDADSVRVQEITTTHRFID